MARYKKIKAPESYPGHKYPDGRVLEHHLVWWQRTGEVVPAGHVVHHKNKDGLDNRFENLELMLWGSHTRHHHLVEEDRELICGWCGTKFTRIARMVRFKGKAGAEIFYCSKSHATLAQYHESQDADRVQHGTVSGYRHHKCRCDECRKAHRDALRKYRRNKGT